MANVLNVASSASTVTATVTGLMSGTTYYVWIKARNSSGISDYSALAADVTTKFDPGIGFAAITKNYDDTPFALVQPTSLSGGAFSYSSGTPSVATISGSTVTIVAAGTTVITVTQASSGVYAQGIVTATLTVNPIYPTLSGFGAVVKTYADPAFHLTAPSSDSGGSFSYSSSDPSIAAISGDLVTIVGVGNSIITAIQAATINCTAGSVNMMLTANPIPLILGFGATTKDYGDAPFALSPSSNSSGAFTFSSSNAAVATVNGSTATIVGGGVTTITAAQAATGFYSSGSISATLKVNPIAPTLGGFGDITKSCGDASFLLPVPTSDSSGSFSYSSGSTSVATIINTREVEIHWSGTSLITITQAATANHTGSSISATLTVSSVLATVTTTVATDINPQYVHSGGVVSSEGGANVTARGVCWALTANPTTANSKTSNGTGAGSFFSTLMPLLPGKTYYYRAYATNSVGISYDATIRSVTTPTAVPTVLTTSATGITQTTATSGGLIASDGGGAITAKGVCWSANPNPTTANSFTNDGTGSNAFSGSLTGLVPGRNYWVRAYATNSAGTGCGNQQSCFTLPALPPSVLTQPVGSILSTSAQANGSLTSDGGDPACIKGICWAEHADPVTGGADSALACGTGTGDYSIQISPLVSGHHYYVRAWANNTTITSYGSAVEFDTP